MPKAVRLLVSRSYIALKAPDMETFYVGRNHFNALKEAIDRAKSLPEGELLECEVRNGKLVCHHITIRPRLLGLIGRR